jgi:hypothetical protein
VTVEEGPNSHKLYSGWPSKSHERSVGHVNPPASVRGGWEGLSRRREGPKPTFRPPPAHCGWSAAGPLRPGMSDRGPRTEGRIAILRLTAGASISSLGGRGQLLPARWLPPSPTVPPPLHLVQAARPRSAAGLAKAPRREAPNLAEAWWREALASLGQPRSAAAGWRGTGPCRGRALSQCRRRARSRCGKTRRGRCARRERRSEEVNGGLYLAIQKRPVCFVVRLTMARF